MACLIGFDPGGRGSFGWCVSWYSDALPLKLHDMGVSDHAQGAVEAAFAAVPPGQPILAIGVDSPMFWACGNDRRVDQEVRCRIRDLAPQACATVQSVNSLRGACVVQGILAAILVRDRLAGIPISESHPKAILWLLREAVSGREPAAIRLGDLSRLFLPDRRDTSDHERDSAIACLSAWAMVHRPHDWEDIASLEERRYLPVCEPLGYWIPCRR